jgi:hypothetical protein
MFIDLKKFGEALSGAKANEIPEQAYPVLPYLSENLMTPLRRDRTVMLGDLDYSLFSIDDLHMLFEYIQNCGELNDKLSGINRFFYKAVPIAEINPGGSVRRPFC